jgi:hypothetical protein
MAQRPLFWLIGMAEKSRSGNQRLRLGETLLRTRLSRRIELVDYPHNLTMDTPPSVVKAPSWLQRVPCLQAEDEQNRPRFLLHS